MSKSSSSPRDLILLMALTLAVVALSPRPARAVTFTQRQVDAAVQAHDTATLTTFCFENEDLDDAWRSACRALIADYEAKGDGVYLMRICKANERRWHTDFYADACAAGKRVQAGAYQQDLADCAQVPTVYQKYESNLTREAQDELFYAVGQRAAACKAWDYLWTSLVHQGGDADGRGLVLLRKLAAGGVDVEAELLAYLTQHAAAPFAFEFGRNATGHALIWLRESGKVGKCDRFVPFAKRANDENLGTWLAFFADTECPAGAPLALGRLSSKKPDQRRQACVVLGAIGTKKHIAKLKIVARKDPEYKLEYVRGAAVKTYWVREACDAAIGTIQLR